MGNDFMATGRASDKFMLRLPDGMRERIAEEAKTNSRTMNAEIVARLQSTLEGPSVETLRRLLEAERKRSAELAAELMAKDADHYRRALYILLDTNGYPIAWNEVFELLRAIKKAGGFDPAEVHTQIITPDLESSSRRHQQAAELARRLRAEGKSRAINPDADLPAAEPPAAAPEAKKTVKVVRRKKEGQ